MSDYVSIVFYKGQQRAPVIFPVQSWHEAALRQGHAALSSKNFSEKSVRASAFFPSSLQS